MPMPAPRWMALLCVATLAGCAGDAPADSPPAPPAVGGDRPVEVITPPGYQEDRPAPLLLVLHGYDSSPEREEPYFGFPPVVAGAGMLYATPRGTVDGRGNAFWNATDACCGGGRSEVDDSGYLRRVIDDVRRRYAVDPKRIYIFGISNGGFMAHRMACDHADVVAAVVSAAGAPPLAAQDCRPTAPVAVLQVHGDADRSIEYEGGVQHAEFPGAAATVTGWARRNGCAATPRPGPPRDLATAVDVFTDPTPLDGPETRTVSYPHGCRPGGWAELWTIAGGGHVPALSDTYAQQVVDFLLAHPKP